MNSATLLFELADHVAVITLSRSEVRNAMNRERCCPPLVTSPNVSRAMRRWP